MSTPLISLCAVYVVMEGVMGVGSSSVACFCPGEQPQDCHIMTTVRFKPPSCSILKKLHPWREKNEKKKEL